jgi:hypothetical protein
MRRGVNSLAIGALVLAVSSGVHGDGKQRAISLQQHTYQAVTGPPFNGQLAFYAADIPSDGAAVRLPITVQILIGNGRRPFVVDTGRMRPDEFDAYVRQLRATGAVRVMGFSVRARGERVTFDYLSRPFSVTASELVPCRGCPGRVTLTLE